MRKTADEYAQQVREKIGFSPKIGIVLGSGLGDLGEKIENPVFVEYSALEGFPVSTAPGHKGRFAAGTLSGKQVICMQGRLHFYEGHNMADILLPIRTMRRLGVEILILTNAAGGINTAFSVGDIMLIEDHINFMGRNPLVGQNDDAFGCRFPDMSYAYDPQLRAWQSSAPQKQRWIFVKAFTLPVRARVMKRPPKSVRSVLSVQTR